MGTGAEGAEEPRGLQSEEVWGRGSRKDRQADPATCGKIQTGEQRGILRTERD